MRLKLLLVLLGGLLLLVAGFVPGKLPFNPGARYSDAVTSHWPAAVFLRQSVLDEQTFPLWRETTMAGAPFAANPLNKTAYPLQWLALLFPPALHLDILILLHLLIAGVGMWRWARQLGLRPEAAGLSALAYALGPRLIGHTGAGHVDLLYAAAWFPWLMESVVPSPLAPQGEGSKQGAQPLRWALRIALFAGLVFLADTRLSLFAVGLAGAYFTYRVAPSGQWKRLLWLIRAGAVILLLTTSVTVPLIGWSPYLSRAGLTSQEAGVFSLEPAQFIGLITPQQGGNIESLTYMGWPVLMLAGLAALVMPRKLGFWLGALAFAAWYALGENGWLWTSLVKVIPALLWFRVPSRAWFVVALVMPLLAGYGFQWLMMHMGRRAPRRWRLFALIALVAATTCGLFTLLALSLPDGAGWTILIGGGGLALILFLLLHGRLKADRAAALIIAVTFADLLISARGWLEWRGEESWLLPYAPLATTLIEDGADRIYSPTYSLPQQVAAAYDLQLFGGVDPFQIEAVSRAVAQAGEVELSGYNVVAPPLIGIEGDDPATANRDAVPNTELLAQWNVSHVVSAYAMNNDGLHLLDEVGGIFVYRNADYFEQVETTDIVPRWPAGWEGLPDGATVEQLNQLTLAAAVVGAASLLVCILLIFRFRR